MLNVVLFILSLTIGNVSAEYRAYLLDVNVQKGVKQSGEKIEQHKLLVSNLDGGQYTAWYNLNAGQVLTLASWMCWGNTSNFKRPCEKPVKDLGAQSNGRNN